MFIKFDGQIINSNTVKKIAIVPWGDQKFRHMIVATSYRNEDSCLGKFDDEWDARKATEDIYNGIKNGQDVDLDYIYESRDYAVMERAKHMNRSEKLEFINRVYFGEEEQ